MLEICEKIPGIIFYRSCYNNESYAKERGSLRWKLVRKTPADNSMLKKWDEQQFVISDNDEVPIVQVIIYTLIGHYLSTGERLFKQTFVRTSSVDSGGYHVAVIFGTKGLFVSNYWAVSCSDNLGISVARKSAVTIWR
jgi:hypothetical protein